MDSLDGPRWKLRRAVRGVEELGAEITAFNNTKPYEVLRYDDPRTQEHIFQVRVYQEPPALLGVIVGEIIHNLRSALDHLACILPLQANAQRPAKPEFPVFDLRDPDPADKSRLCFAKNHRLGPVTPDALAAVEALQPYNAGAEAKSHPLRILTDLWNWDKHNAIHVVSASQIPPNIPGQVVRGGVSFADEGPIHDGQVVARVSLDGFTVVNDNPEPIEDLHIAIAPAFGGDGPAAGKLIAPILGGLCQYVSVNAMGPLERIVLESRGA